MSNLLKHLEREFKAMGWPTEGEDDMQVWVYKNLKELLSVFVEQGHSGSSAPYVAGLFGKLAMFEPLGPLTGKDDEWQEVEYGMFQNLRCSHVFKGADGRAYDMNGKVFREPNGVCYTSRESRVYVEFPYTPVTEYVDVEAEDV